MRSKVRFANDTIVVKASELFQNFQSNQNVNQNKVKDYFNKKCVIIKKYFKLTNFTFSSYFQGIRLKIHCK